MTTVQHTSLTMEWRCTDIMSKFSFTAHNPLSVTTCANWTTTPLSDVSQPSKYSAHLPSKPFFLRCGNGKCRGSFRKVFECDQYTLGVMYHEIRRGDGLLILLINC